MSDPYDTHDENNTPDDEYTAYDDPTVQWEEEAWEYLEWRLENNDEEIPF